ncbi:MAG: hypothetical protein KatS3mg131_0487 [Candidatus Tectimicrobiota bacterium]|nr:MAG: hypothetical protein KatS3mg131_0487 [Candidatus Tectomicrobia bacterium]
MNWQRLVGELWPQVRQKHLWPELPMPRVAALSRPVALEMRDKRLTLNLSTCEALARWLPPRTVVEALLDHGISHYTRCPWDLATHLHLYAVAKAELGCPSLARAATDAFIDVVANTYCVKDYQTPLPQVCRYFQDDPLQRTLVALYGRIWGVDMQAEADEALVRRLARLPYLDRRQWPQSLRRFAQLLRPLLEASGRLAPPPLGQHGLGNYSREEVEKALATFAQQAPDIEAFRNTVADFADELLALGYGGGEGEGRRVDADALYYMALAQNYRLPVCSLPATGSGTLDPYSHAPWEASKPVQDLDVWTSFGKLLPGLSQLWVRRQGTVFGQRQRTPDCLIVLDSSGSMPNPRQQLSYAVLGAACAADAYLRRGARVAVYNFSDARLAGKTVLAFTADRTAIFRCLCVYHGGGTALALRDLEALRRTAPQGTPDLVLITDMQITNLEEVLAYLAGVEGRITVVHLGDNAATERLRHATATHPRLRLFAVTAGADIPAIILGQVRHDFALALGRRASAAAGLGL